MNPPDVRVVLTELLGQGGSVWAARYPHRTVATINCDATIGEVCGEVGNVLTQAEWLVIRTAHGWPAQIPLDLLRRRWPAPPPAIRSRLFIDPTEGC